jgi:serine/threonine protein kinase
MDEQTQTNPFPPDKLFVPPPGYNDLSGKTLGGYRLVRKIAQGGMGVIYEATQIKLSRKVALKVLSEQLANRPEFFQRFEREAKAAASLNHPNIVQVHDFGEADGRHYIIMEFIEGDNLSDYVAKHGKIPVENALAIIEQAALALKAAAEKSIVHRDIKPSNLMVTRDGRVKVADMGLAKILTEDSELTMSSVSIGSPHFIAPEQASSSKTADHRVDIYSLGVTLLYLVTGKYAYDGDSPISIVLAHATKPLPSGAELGTDLPQEIEALIRHMAAKNPDQRYQNYDELLPDLQLVKQGYLPAAAPVHTESEPKRSNKILVAAIPIIAVVILAAAAVIATKVFKHPTQSIASSSNTAQTPTAANTPSTPPSATSPENQPPPQQQPDNFAGRPPMSQGQPPDQQNQQGFGGDDSGMPRFPLPMGPPPAMPSANLIPDGSLDTMLATADDYAKQNPTDYMGILARYRIVQQKANQLIMQRIIDAVQAQVIQTRIDTWVAEQNTAASQAIIQYTDKMQQDMNAGGPMAALNAYRVWRDFPANLRSRNTDQQIIQVLKRILPQGFEPPMNPNGQGLGNGQGPFGGFPPGGNGPGGPPMGQP